MNFDFTSYLSAARNPPEPFKEIKETESTNFNEPSAERKMYDGTQKIWKFKNGYGADIVRHYGSYGHEEGLWEMAVLEFDSKGEWTLTYNTPITENVIGYLSEKEVEAILERVKALEAKQV